MNRRSWLRSDCESPVPLDLKSRGTGTNLPGAELIPHLVVLLTLIFYSKKLYRHPSSFTFVTLLYPPSREEVFPFYRSTAIAKARRRIRLGENGGEIETSKYRSFFLVAPFDTSFGLLRVR